MNPCPCGYLGDEHHHCRCTPDQIKRYQGRVSGPLLDRIDLHVHVPRLPPALLLQPAPAGEGSAEVQRRVTACRERQLRRQQCSNARLDCDQLLTVCALDSAQQQALASAATDLKLSGRGLHRTLRVARTIADMADRPDISSADLAEALAYRQS